MAVVAVVHLAAAVLVPVPQHRPVIWRKRTSNFSPIPCEKAFERKP